MLDVNIKLVRSSERELENSIKRMAKTAGIGLPKAVAFAAFTVSRSAGVVCKEGKSKGRREIIDNPDRRRTKKGKGWRGAKYLIVVKRQGKPDRFIPTNRKSDKRRKIANRNLAYYSWRVAAAKCMHKTPPQSKSRTRGDKFVKVVRRMNPRNPSITITNRLTYLDTAFPHMEATSITKGRRGFEKMVQKKIARKVARQWQ